MNILFLSTWYPHPADNGSKIRVRALLEALAREHEVTLAAFAFGTADASDSAALAMCRAVHSVAEDPFVRTARRRAGSLATLSPLSDRPLPAMSALVNCLIRQRRYDAVIASTTVTAVYALKAINAARILEEHNLHTEWTRRRYRRATGRGRRLRAWFVWYKRRRYDRRLFRQFDLVTMVSPAETSATAALLAGSRTRSALVPNGIDCRHHRPGLLDRQPDTLVYNGSLTYAANYDAMRYFLTEIFPAIREAVPGARLLITGSHEGVDLSELPLTNVTLTGLVDDIRTVVGSATVAIAPIIDGAGTRLKVLEAMALGTPVVASSLAVAGLDVHDGREVRIADASADFARAVITLLQSSEHRQVQAVAARALVETHYEWAKIGRHFLGLVEATTALRLQGATAAGETALA